MYLAWAACHRHRGRETINNLIHSVYIVLPAAFVKWKLTEPIVAAQSWLSEFQSPAPGSESQSVTHEACNCKQVAEPVFSVPTIPHRGNKCVNAYKRLSSACGT